MMRESKEWRREEDTGRRVDRRSNQTQLSELARGKDIDVVLFVVANREESCVELLELHQVLVPHTVERNWDFAPRPHYFSTKKKKVQRERAAEISLAETKWNRPAHIKWKIMGRNRPFSVTAQLGLHPTIYLGPVAQLGLRPKTFQCE